MHPTSSQLDDIRCTEDPRLTTQRNYKAGFLPRCEMRRDIVLVGRTVSPLGHFFRWPDPPERSTDNYPIAWHTACIAHVKNRNRYPNASPNLCLILLRARGVRGRNALTRCYHRCFCGSGRVTRRCTRTPRGGKGKDRERVVLRTVPLRTCLQQSHHRYPSKKNIHKRRSQKN